MPVLAVIPARLGSARLPRKPLQVLAGEPLVVRVAQHIQAMGVADRLVVATDAEAVASTVEAAGFPAMLTRPSHRSGTDRVAEIAGLADHREFDVILNLQGDEPFLPLEAVTGALDRLSRGDDIGTAAAPLAPEEAGNPDRVKVVTDLDGRALYFSRAAIPGSPGGNGPPPEEYWVHLGLYAFRRTALARWVTLAPTPLEEVERLEQLRALQHGFRIGVARLRKPAPPGVDTVEDLALAEAYWHRMHEDGR